MSLELERGLPMVVLISHTSSSIFRKIPYGGFSQTRSHMNSILPSLLGAGRLSLLVEDVHWFLALCKGLLSKGWANQLVRSKFPHRVPQFHLPALYILIDKALFQLHYEFILIHTGRSGPHLWEASIVENVLDTDCPLQGCIFDQVWRIPMSQY